MISVIVYISIVLYMMMDIYELNCWCNSYPIAIINLLDVTKLHNTSIFLFTMNYLALKRKTASFVLLLNMLLQDQFANKPRLWIRLSRTSRSNAVIVNPYEYILSDVLLLYYHQIYSEFGYLYLCLFQLVLYH